MNVLQHIIEPRRLWLTWQPLDEHAPVRTRRIVGEVCKEETGQVVFRYLKDSADFKAASDAGFKGFPAFKLSEPEVRQGVIESLMRRLPPRKREDFAGYLARHALPSPFGYSDFALLAYTGARLPSDGFALVPEFPPDAIPCDYVTEVAGLRHVFDGDTQKIRLGDSVSFKVDKHNWVDADAVAVIYHGRQVGYVNRAIRHTVKAWLGSHKVDATVWRLNGNPERPLLYLKISVS